MKIEQKLTRCTRTTTRVEVIVKGSLADAMRHAAELAQQYVSETMIVDVTKLDGDKYAIGVDYGSFADTAYDDPNPKPPPKEAKP